MNINNYNFKNKILFNNNNNNNNKFRKYNNNNLNNYKNRPSSGYRWRERNKKK